MNAKLFGVTLIMAVSILATGSLSLAGDMPEQVSLDTMVKYFSGVKFDHAMHTELGEDCSRCHHHTTGTGTTDSRCVSCHADSDGVANVACRDCHVVDPFSAEHLNQKALSRYQFHIDKPGLKAVYHWNCVGCHETMSGPTGCQTCHTRTPDGDAFFHADASPVDTNWVKQLFDLK
ncbi:MAG: cytochrome c3 family protein [Desulfuromonadales bacterium]|nr:cytochrome c3 family protein [Desulfuromonadales bacterium]MDT8422998.1 cytochrome c3 family protein [Desulfuromonadales bacterium]